MGSMTAEEKLAKLKAVLAKVAEGLADCRRALRGENSWC